MTGLPDGAGPDTYVAPDFDTLVDSPIVIGNPDVHELMRLSVTVAAEPPKSWRLQRLVTPTVTQQNYLTRWLGDTNI